MATITDLIPKVLRKVGILPFGQQPNAEDAEVANDKLLAVHASLDTQRLLEWTTQDIPQFAVEPYIAMAAFLGADEFGRPADPVWWPWGLHEIQAAVQLKNTETVQADYF